MYQMLGTVHCGLLALAPHRSADNGVEYVHRAQQCYLRRDANFTRNAPIPALFFAGDLVEPDACENIVLHVLGLSASPEG